MSFGKRMPATSMTVARPQARPSAARVVFAGILGAILTRLLVGRSSRCRSNGSDGGSTDWCCDTTADGGGGGSDGGDGGGD